MNWMAFEESSMTCHYIFAFGIFLCISFAYRSCLKHLILCTIFKENILYLIRANLVQSHLYRSLSLPFDVYD